MDPMKILGQTASLNSDELMKVADEEESRLGKLAEARKTGDTEAIKELTNQGGNNNVEVVIKPMTGTSGNQGSIELGFDRKGTMNTEANSRRLELENAIISNLSLPQSEGPTEK
jgi:hypothetical protein